MHLFRISLALLPFGLNVFFNSANAQVSKDDINYYNTSLQNAKAVYHQNSGNEAAWMNGRVNIPYNFVFEKGSPYFQTDRFTSGTLNYEGVSYTGLPLLLDELSNSLITILPNGRLELTLARVDGFKLLTKDFVRVSEGKSKVLSEGYYQLLYNGRTKVLMKNKKSIREDLVSGEGIVRSIEEKKLYFLEKGNEYYQVDSKKSLLEILKDKKPELQEYIKKEKLKWKKDAERLIAVVAAYYDQLTK